MSKPVGSSCDCLTNSSAIWGPFLPSPSLMGRNGHLKIGTRTSLAIFKAAWSKSLGISWIHPNRQLDLHILRGENLRQSPDSHGIPQHVEGLEGTYHQVVRALRMPRGLSAAVQVVFERRFACEKMAPSLLIDPKRKEIARPGWHYEQHEPFHSRYTAPSTSSYASRYMYVKLYM